MNKNQKQNKKCKCGKEVEVPINEELYHSICKELGSGNIFFMAIA